jgi:hypothetical protein
VLLSASAEREDYGEDAQGAQRYPSHIFVAKEIQLENWAMPHSSVPTSI